MEYFSSIDAIDTDDIEKRIADLQLFLERPRLELRNTFNTRLSKVNETFRKREEALTKEGGAFLERRTKSLALEYLTEVLKLSKEYKSHAEHR